MHENGRKRMLQLFPTQQWCLESKKRARTEGCVFEMTNVWTIFTRAKKK
jgi:hypothetical protein